MTDYKIGLSHPAREDLKDITEYTQERYGAQHTEAYKDVLQRAFEAIREDPMRPGSRDRAGDGNQPGLRSYHTALSNAPSKTNVKSPRHVILYTEPREGVITVARVIHDSRDIERSLSPKRPPRQVYKANAPNKDQGRER